MRKLFLLTVVCLLFSCTGSKSDYEQIFNNEQIAKTKVLGHKGSGTYGTYGNSGYKDNSVKGIVNALNKVDGAEADIQMDADSVLRLFHDHTVTGCDSNTLNFFDLTDSLQNKLSTCSEHFSSDRLSELFQNTKGFEGKILSLDLKVLQNPKVIEAFGSHLKAAEFVAAKIEELLPSALEVAIEVPFEEQLTAFSNIGVQVFMLCNDGDRKCIEKAVDGKVGLSVSVKAAGENSDLINKAAQNELPVQLWVANHPDDLLTAFQLGVDYIQTDRPDAALYIKKLHQSGVEEELLFEKDNKDASNEFFEFFTLNPNDFEDALIKVQFKTVENMGSEFKWVAAVHQQNTGSNIYWRGSQTQKGYNEYWEFVNAENLKEKNARDFKFYIWNEERKPTLLRAIKVKKITAKSE